MIVLHSLYNDLRMACVDKDDPTGKRILRLAKSAAVEYLDGKEAKSRVKLVDLFKDLSTNDLNPLAMMWMILHPTIRAGATGEGGIWAAASDIVNDVALEVLRDRPAFEVAN